MTGQKRQKYTAEFKEEAVKLVTEQGYGIAEAARNLGINAGMLGRWVQRTRRNPDTAGRAREQIPDQARIRQLEAENRRLKMEREILKKATAFFAKDSN